MRDVKDNCHIANVANKDLSRIPLPVPDVPRRLVSQLSLITKGVDLPFKKFRRVLLVLPSRHLETL
jgi:hypothetical protein